MNENLDIPEPDRVYETLIEAQSDLSNDEARQFMARLTLLLAAKVGSADAIVAAVAAARASVLEDR